MKRILKAIAFCGILSTPILASEYASQEGLEATQRLEQIQVPTQKDDQFILTPKQATEIATLIKDAKLHDSVRAFKWAFRGWNTLFTTALVITTQNISNEASLLITVSAALIVSEFCLSAYFSNKSTCKNNIIKKFEKIGINADQSFWDTLITFFDAL